MKEIGRRRSLSRKKSLRRRKKIRRRKMAGEKAKGRKAKAAVARRDLQDESHGGLDTSGIRRAKAVAQVAAKKAKGKGQFDQWGGEYCHGGYRAVNGEFFPQLGCQLALESDSCSQTLFKS